MTALEISEIFFKACISGCWRDVLVFKTICCSCGGPSSVPSFYTVAKNLIHTGSFRKI